MNKVDSLIESYKRHISMPYRKEKSLTQRTWIAVYPPEEELRLRIKLDEFEILTKDNGYDWKAIDLMDAIADWLDSLDKRKKQECLADDMDTAETADPLFKRYLVKAIENAIGKQNAVDCDKTVFAITGTMGIYDLTFISDVFEDLHKDTPGSLLLFFPGEKEGNIYKFLNARKGWNYMAVPILTES